jgi:hypothetical protein
VTESLSQLDARGKHRLIADSKAAQVRLFPHCHLGYLVHYRTFAVSCQPGAVGQEDLVWKDSLGGCSHDYHPYPGNLL